MRWLTRIVALALLLGLSPATAAASPVEYTAVELPSLGGLESRANAVNDRGMIVGASQTSSGSWVATAWMDREPLDLGAGPGSTARDVNKKGAIVGSWQVGGESHGFLWIDGVLTDLGRFTPLAINDRLQIVGEAPTDSGVAHAHLWSAGMLVDLGSLGTVSYATDINNRGQVVGGSLLANGQRRAFLWEDGVMSDLGTLGGNYSEAKGINDRGVITGGSNVTSTPGLAFLHAFVWDDGDMRDLGSIGGNYAVGTSINNHGVVAGESSVAGDDNLTKAFVTIDHSPVQLPTPDEAWSFGSDLNKRGDVVGWVTTRNDTGPTIAARLWTTT